MGGTITGRSASALPGLDAAEQRAWEHFLDATLRMYGTLNRTLSVEHQLSLLDVRLLDILRNSETGAARMGDLAERLLSLPSRVTRQIRRLEDAGLVLREASPEDGRGVLASITEQGRQVVAAAIVTYSDEVRRQFVQPLTRPQMSAMGENCRRISTGLKNNGRSTRS
ncbi:MAG: MarR family winged helix-turn-helix transcriptional regulator [Mycobacterium sp.]